MNEVMREVEKIRQIAIKHGFTVEQAEILAQLTYLNPNWLHEYGIMDVKSIANGHGIRLKSIAGVTIDIVYEPVSDLYHIKIYDSKSMKKIADYPETTWEEMGEIVKNAVMG